ncbi:hypothetical protein HII31_08447 [Pseudocercospora fuligena]|uniref:Uncharacterized protein n=1 Tax=Pseudocercospora fuligena TaxID=685502 RepID=A0A8H6RHG2_9PEZI|nr:hypothetical protein HII31_08447 [Pseudocercospora fuligena]
MKKHEPFLASFASLVRTSTSNKLTSTRSLGMHRSSSVASSRTMGHQTRLSTALDDINKRRKTGRRNEILSSGSGSRDGYLATPRTFSYTHTSRIAPIKTTDDLFADLKTHMGQQLEAEKAKVKALEDEMAKREYELIAKSSEARRLRKERDNAKNELALERSAGRKLKDRLRRRERVTTAAENVVRAAWKDFGARMDELTTAVKSDR